MVGTKKFAKSMKQTEKVDNATIVKRVKKVEKKVNRIASNIEDKVKFGGVATLTGIQSTVPYTVLLNGLSQGTDTGQRMGSEVNWKYIDLRIFLGIATNAFRAESTFRVMLVKEKPALGGSLSLTSLFGSTQPESIDTYNYDNRDFKTRFMIFYDQVHRVDGIVFSKFINIKKRLNFKTNYSRGNAGDVTDIDTNSLWLLIFTDYPTDTTSLGYKYAYNLFYEDA